MDFDNFDELTARRLMAHMSPYDRETLTTAGVDKSFADGELEKGTKVGRAMQSPKKTAWQRMGAKEAAEDQKKEDLKFRVERPRILDKPHEVKNISDKIVRYRPLNVDDKKSLGDLVDLVKAELTTEAREKLPEKAFALAGGRYPINDAAHARNALARVSQFGTPGEKSKVRSAVHKKFPGIGEGEHEDEKKSVLESHDLVKGEYTRTTRSTVKQRDSVPEVGSRFATSEMEIDVDGTIVPGDRNLHTYDKATKRLYGPQHDYRGTKVNEINTGDSKEESHKSLCELLDLAKALMTGFGRNPAKAAADLTQLRERALSKLGGVPATIKPITADRFQKPEEKKKKLEHVNPRTGAPALAASNAGLDVKRSVDIDFEKTEKPDPPTYNEVEKEMDKGSEKKRVASAKKKIELYLSKAKETMASLDQARKNTEDRLASEKEKFTLAAPPKPLEDLSGAKGVDTTDEYKLHLSKARDFMESFKKSTSGTFGVRAIGKLTQDLREE
jgi:hypothetical protein